MRARQTPAPPISMLASTWVPAKALIDCTTQDTIFPINVEIGGSGGRRFTPVHRWVLSKFQRASFLRWCNNSGINRLGPSFRSLLCYGGRHSRCCRRKPSLVFGRKRPSSSLEKKAFSCAGKEKALLVLGEENFLLCWERRGPPRVWEQKSTIRHGHMCVELLQKGFVRDCIPWGVVGSRCFFLASRQ